MSVKFCFLKSDNTEENLEVVNQKIAEFCGEELKENDFSFIDNVSDIECNILDKSTSDKVTLPLFTSYISHLLRTNQSFFQRMCIHQNRKFMACLPKFLYQDYTFKAWR